MKYAIIEDEVLALDRLKKMISRLFPTWENVFCGESISEAVELFTSAIEVDLVFMDIELTDGNCFEIFKKVEVNIPIIFTTAYDEYALKAFKVVCVDYLLKPVNVEELSSAVEKFEKIHKPQKPQGEFGEQLARLAQMLQPKSNKRILITCGDNFTYAELDSIAWFELEDDYVFAILKDGSKKMTTHRSLTRLMDELSEHEYFQLSRNVIASISSVDKVSKYFRGRLSVHLKAGSNELKCLVSGPRRDSFLSWMGS